MKWCKVCKKNTKLERQVNYEGIVFWSVDCYEEIEHSPNNNDYPYINAYVTLRFENI